ncbi:Outer membrane efflux protein [compost metagenome]
MVRSLITLLVTTASVGAFAQGPVAAPLSPAGTKVIILSQRDVAELALKQGFRTKEVNLTYQQNRFPYVQTLSLYDWQLSAETGFEQDKSASLLTGNGATDSKYERYRTIASLSKPFTTGTTLGLELTRLSVKTDLGTFSTPTPPPSEQTLDSAGIILEQALLGNFFGVADRAIVNSAEASYKASEIIWTNELEEVVLEAIRLYWDTYVSQENFKEATASRDRYKQLVDSVKRKTSLGYSAPGELSQVQAEFEGREQTVKLASTAFLTNMENLVTNLDLPTGTEIQFATPKDIPPVPKLVEKKVEDLRIVKSQKLKVEAANDSLTAAKSERYPTLNLVGRAYTSGVDETSEGSYSELASGTRPKYYIGLRFAYNFGSDIQKETVITRRLQKELEETRLQRQLLQSQDSEDQAVRRVQATYAIAQSAAKQKVFREKAATELTRSFNQGRTDISILIEALNKFFSSEVVYSQAVGEYAIALNEWAAVRDELIPDDQAKNQSMK